MLAIIAKIIPQMTSTTIKRLDIAAAWGEAASKTGLRLLCILLKNFFAVLYKSLMAHFCGPELLPFRPDFRNGSHNLKPPRMPSWLEMILT